MTTTDFQKFVIIFGMILVFCLLLFAWGYSSNHNYFDKLDDFGKCNWTCKSALRTNELEKLCLENCLNYYGKV